MLVFFWDEMHLNTMLLNIVEVSNVFLFGNILLLFKIRRYNMELHYVVYESVFKLEQK